MIAPRINIQKIPTSKPDFAKTNGSPNIPAPIIVPLSVNVVAKTFLFIVSPYPSWLIMFLRILANHENFFKESFSGFLEEDG